ncbi:unnamed protein product [marine sediment metagenome]|uniref:Uncharacterized protein n=1 Tax=marine sediment metagenome TaxID=412755 RepID=X0VE88_9ZZZZ
MTKEEAEHKGYCKHCAAWGHERGCRYGVAKAFPTDECGLTAETVVRWKGEFGLEGEIQRSPSRDSFGDVDLMKKKRGRKAKRYLK